MTLRSPPKGPMPRGETGRTFRVGAPALTGCEVHDAPPFAVVQVSTRQSPGPTCRERYTREGSSWSSVRPPE